MHVNSLSDAFRFQSKLLFIGAMAFAMLTPLWAASPEQVGSEPAPVYGIRIPSGYRDWTLISVASVGAPVNDTRAKLGNDVAISAYRQDKTPFPDGTIIVRLAYEQGTSQEGNEAFEGCRGIPQVKHLARMDDFNSPASVTPRSAANGAARWWAFRDI